MKLSKKLLITSSEVITRTFGLDDECLQEVLESYSLEAKSLETELIEERASYEG